LHRVKSMPECCPAGTLFIRVTGICDRKNVEMTEICGILKIFCR
jgi:hypothetical protein